MFDFAVGFLKEMLPGVGLLLLIGFAIFLAILPTIAAWRSKHLVSIDKKLDRLLELLGDDQDSDEEPTEE